MMHRPGCPNGSCPCEEALEADVARARAVLDSAVPHTVKLANGEVEWDGESFIVKIPSGLAATRPPTKEK